MKKKILIFVIILIVLLLGALTAYKLLIKKNVKTEEFSSTKISETKKDETSTEKKDKETYSSNVINDDVKKYDYDLIINDAGIVGSVFIGTDSKIYIKDNNSNTYKVSDILFKTLYRIEDANEVLDLYALTNDGTLYYIFLKDLDIKKTAINAITTNFKITNFTNIKIKDPLFDIYNNIVVLSENGNMYEPRSGIRYRDKLISFQGEYFINEDNTIANSFGNLLRYGDENYKIKYFLTFIDNGSPFKDVYSVIITENNKIIYCLARNDTLMVYNKTIKDIQYTIVEGKYKIVNLVLTFTDNSKMNFDAMYTEYYGFE